MRPDPLFANLPDREDLGVDDDYSQLRAIKGLFLGIALSLHFWIALAYTIYRLTHRH